MMRLSLLAALAITTVVAVETRDANAVVYCVEGAYRAGCVVRPVVGARRPEVLPGVLPGVLSGDPT